jgi:hypothetical protein
VSFRFATVNAAACAGVGRIDTLMTSAIRNRRGEVGVFRLAPSETKGRYESITSRGRDGDISSRKRRVTNKVEPLASETWLGGRDSNPDNVVQRASDGLWSASVGAVLGRSSRSPSRRRRCVSLCSCPACLTVSHPTLPTGLLSTAHLGNEREECADDIVRSVSQIHG